MHNQDCDLHVMGLAWQGTTSIGQRKGLAQMEGELNDFIVLAAPDSPQCQEALNVVSLQLKGTRVLNHKCTVVHPGWSFMRWKVNCLKYWNNRQAGRAPLQPVQYICLNRKFQLDLLWRQIFAQRLNGVAIMLPSPGRGRGSWGEGDFGRGDLQ